VVRFSFKTLCVCYIPRWCTCPQSVAHQSSIYLIATQPWVERLNLQPFDRNSDNLCAALVSGPNENHYIGLNGVSQSVGEWNVYSLRTYMSLLFLRWCHCILLHHTPSQVVVCLRQEAEAKWRYESELREQLARQSAAHSDHLVSVLHAQRLKLEAEFEKQLVSSIRTEKLKMMDDISALAGRVSAVESAVNG